MSESWGTPGGGWGNPVVGGAALRIPALTSPNFNLANPTASPNPSWAILANGLAYFFGVVLAGGTITGPDYIINTAGIFFYSGTPALGNLIGSWTTSAGTDAFGNVYGPGLTIGSPSASTPQIQLIPSAGGPTSPAVLQFTLSPLAFFGNQPNIQAASPGSSGQMIISGPGLAAAGFIDFVQDVYSSYVGTTPAARQVNYKSIAGALFTYLNISCFGAQIPAGTINAVDPTTGTAAVPAIPEGWHAITLDAGWSTLGGQPVPSYRFLADGARTVVELCGAAQFNVNIANTNLNGANPLPAVYRPATAPFIAGAPGAAGVNILTNGVIVAAQGGLATPFCNFSGIYPTNL